MFPYTYKSKKIQLGVAGIGNIVLWEFRSRCSSRLHKILKFNDKCTPTISGR